MVLRRLALNGSWGASQGPNITRIIKKVDTRRNAARLLFPYYQKNFLTKVLETNDSNNSRISREFVGIPNDYSKLIKDPEYETLIVEAIGGRRNFKRGYESTIQSTEKCIELIDRYLAN